MVNSLKNSKFFFVVICLGMLISLIVAILNNSIVSLDTTVYNLISQYLINDSITPIIKFITNFGGTIVLITIAICSFFVFNDKKISLCLCLDLLIIKILNIIIKLIVARPRPVGINIISENGFSFPSGHSMVSAAFYGLIIYLIYYYVKNKPLKIFLIILLTFLIIGIGVSRIYLGVHYPSDVLGGWLLALAFLIIYLGLVQKHFLNKTINKK